MAYVMEADTDLLGIVLKGALRLDSGVWYISDQRVEEWLNRFENKAVKIEISVETGAKKTRKGSK